MQQLNFRIFLIFILPIVLSASISLGAGNACLRLFHLAIPRIELSPYSFLKSDLAIGTKARVGIYFGTFDPVHEGHIAVAKAALIEANLDEVIFVPNSSAPHKPNASSFEMRSAMLAARLLDEPKLNVLLDDHGTIRDGGRDGLSRDLLIFNHAKQIVQVVGQDSFETAMSKQAGKPNRNFIVFSRGDDPIKVSKKFADYVSIGTYKDPGVSSTVVRNQIKNGEIPLPTVLDPRVFDYIRTHHLYGF